MTDAPEFEFTPILEADEEWPPIPIRKAVLTFMVHIPEATTLPEALDLAIHGIGRFGVEQHDIIIDDEENPGVRWLVRRGALYDLAALRGDDDDDATDG